MSEKECNELRVKVALLLGHKWVRYIKPELGKETRIYYQLLEPRHLSQDWWKRQGGVLVEPSEIPNTAETKADTDHDWPNDLNACHEFEKALTDSDKNFYVIHLSKEIGLAGRIAGITGSTVTAFKFTTATAEQRCRAFIATMEPPSDPSGNEKQPVSPGSPKSASGLISYNKGSAG